MADYDIQGKGYIGWNCEIYDKDGNNLGDWNYIMLTTSSTEPDPATLAEVAYSHYIPIVPSGDGAPDKPARLTLFSRLLGIPASKFPIFIKQKNSGVVLCSYANPGSTSSQYMRYTGNYGLGGGCYQVSGGLASTSASYVYNDTVMNYAKSGPVITGNTDFSIPVLMNYTEGDDIGASRTTSQWSSYARALSLPASIDDSPSLVNLGNSYTYQYVASNNWSIAYAFGKMYNSSTENSRSIKSYGKYTFYTYDGDSTAGGTQVGAGYFPVVELPWKLVDNGDTPTYITYNTTSWGNIAYMGTVWIKSPWIKQILASGCIHVNSTLSETTWGNTKLAELGVSASQTALPEYTEVSANCELIDSHPREDRTPSAWHPYYQTVDGYPHQMYTSSVAGGSMFVYGDGSFATRKTYVHEFLLSPLYYNTTLQSGELVWGGQFIWYDEDTGEYDADNVFDYGFNYNPGLDNDPKFGINRKCKFLSRLFEGWIFSEEESVPKHPYEKETKNTIGGGTGTYDSTSDVVQTTVRSMSITHGRRIYEFTNQSEMSTFFQYLWSDNLYGFLESTVYGVQPMDLIIGCNYCPIDVEDIGDTDVLIGRHWDTGATAKSVVAQVQDVDCGSVAIPQYFGSFMDYAPYTNIHFYLPFIGEVPVDANVVMGHAITITYRVDVSNGSCVAFLKKEDGSVVYQFQGSCFMEIPLTGSTRHEVLDTTVNACTRVASAMITSGVSIGSTNITGSQTTATTTQIYGTKDQLTARGAGDIQRARINGKYAPGYMGTISETKTVETSHEEPNEIKNHNISNPMPSGHAATAGNVVGESGFLSINKPYITIERPIQSMPSSYMEQYGVPLNATYKLGDLTGYTEIQSIHLKGFNCTTAEMNEISEKLAGGIHL